MASEKKIPIGLQLFSVRGECSKDLPATLKSVREIGYVGAEPWGYGGDKLEWMGWKVKDIQKMYDDNGLKCCGIHLSTGALIGDNLSRTIEFNKELGNKFLIIAADSQRMSALNTIMELAKILNDASEKLLPSGMFTGYHAHGFDFKNIDGRLAWDILFSNTRSEVVMQMDIGNCASGGGDPIGELKQFPGRARSVHLKDYGGPEGSVIGEGKADWKTIFHLCETSHNTEWYVVEEGGRDGLGFDVSKRSLEALKRMGK
ncbi:sugar phosphate isomerase/epimerase [Candidatus Poribacteria bacterium]|nr:sugar phosphate isomerase/epimerase [Candidatus Poribacteria bacterium]